MKTALYYGNEMYLKMLFYADDFFILTEKGILEIVLEEFYLMAKNFGLIFNMARLKLCVDLRLYGKIMYSRKWNRCRPLIIWKSTWVFINHLRHTLKKPRRKYCLLLGSYNPLVDFCHWDICRNCGTVMYVL